MDPLLLLLKYVGEKCKDDEYSYDNSHKDTNQNACYHTRQLAGAFLKEKKKREIDECSRTIYGIQMFVYMYIHVSAKT